MEHAACEYPYDRSERLFWPRTSEVIDTFADVISRDPERPLTDEQAARVLAFEGDLFEGRYGDLRGPSLKTRKSLTNDDYRLAPEFLMTEGGRKTLIETLGDGEDSEDFTFMLAEDAVAFLYRQPVERYQKTDVLEKLQTGSLSYIKELYAERAQAGEDCTVQVINLTSDPANILTNLQSLDDYRRFIRDVRAELKNGESDDETAAKKMITDIYRDKINAKMAESLPILVGLIPQIDALSDGAIDTTLIPRLMTAVRNVASDGDRTTQFVRMLDYVRNGASLNEDGTLTPIDRSVYDTARETNRRNRETVSNDRPVFTKDEVKAFEEYYFDANEMEDFIAAYNDRLGITKQGWKAEIKDSTDSFAVSGKTKIIKVPSSYRRSIAQTFPAVGVAGIVSHEVGGIKPGHVWQSLNSERNDASLRLGSDVRYRGKRFLALREAGGVYAEATAIAHYFGQTRLVNAGYMKAMDTLLSGGSDSAAVKAFAESQLAGLDDPSENERREAYKLAADRTLRLLRYGGRNSQPLQYVEGAKVREAAASLDDAVVSIMLGEAVFDPIDMMRLHAFGLLPTDTGFFFSPDEDPDTVMTELLRAKLDS